ncbi:MAG: lactonase family protein [Acidimicrobiales bacterium]
MTTRLTRALVAFALTIGVGLAAASAAGADPGDHAGHAVFALTDQATNSVVSYSRSSDGSLAYAGTYATGGAGESASGAAADPLASQGGLALAEGGHVLLAVNSGSNTVSAFDVNGSSLRLVQQVPSFGSFPVSISVHGNVAAVLNSGSTGSVVEYLILGDHLVAIPWSVRSLNLNNTSPPNYLAGAGQVGFSPNGRFLVVTTKSSTSQYEVFAVRGDGFLSLTPTVTNAANGVPFAFVFDPAGRVVAAEAAGSWVTTYSIVPSGALVEINSVSDTQSALCWISTARGYYYGSNAGSGDVSSFTVSPSGTASVLAVSAATAHHGTIDSAASPDGRFLYVESGGAGTIDAFAVNPDGSLSFVQTTTGLPVPFEGIAVS